MAICPYCGIGAGLFSKYHESCFQLAEIRRRRATAVQEIKDLVLAATRENQPCSVARDEVRRLASQYKLPPDVVGQAVLTGVDELSRKEPLTPVKKEYLNQLCDDVLGDVDNVPPGPFSTRFHQVLLNASLSHALWLVMHGQSVDWRTPCELVLQPDEKRLWEFGTTLYRKSVTISSHSGGYNGVSVRIASGLYYRFGGYFGHSLSQQVQNIDNGFLILTNKGIFFAGQRAFGIPYTSVLRFKAYPDGLGFFRSLGDGREEIFTVVDAVATARVRTPAELPLGARYDPANAVTLPVGWFLYNLATFFTTPNQK
jgi:hypothetical protein